LGFADANPTSASITRQAFTPGAAPEVGYEAPFFARSTITTVGSTTTYRPFGQRIEDVRTFANQTVTLSFWAKADSARTLNFFSTQSFGSGGSGAVSSGLTAFSLTTSWQRFTYNFTPPSISGKTIGASSYLEIAFQQAAASGSVLDLWGVQLEPGTVANDFRTNANSLQGELAACQRYYHRFTAATGLSQTIGFGMGYLTTAAYINFTLPVQMRTRVTSIERSGGLVNDLSTNYTPSTFVIYNSGELVVAVEMLISGGTNFRPYFFNITGTNFVGFSAEL
jgi:hypothetical protein